MTICRAELSIRISAEATAHGNAVGPAWFLTCLPGMLSCWHERPAWGPITRPGAAARLSHGISCLTTSCPRNKLPAPAPTKQKQNDTFRSASIADPRDPASEHARRMRPRVRRPRSPRQLDTGATCLEVCYLTTGKRADSHRRRQYITAPLRTDT